MAGKLKPSDLVAAAEAQGWRIKKTKTGWLLIPPDPSKPAVTLHRTPSDHRWDRNALSRLRKSGLITELL